jgi:outer membrane immunogenic protein
MAADLKVPPMYGKAPPPAVQMWGGPYVGVNIGYGFGDWDSTGTYTGSWHDHSIATSSDTSGFFGGIQGGYNWQFNQFVLGVEADLQLSGISGSSELVGQDCVKKCSGVYCDPAVTGDWDMNWFSTIRGRAGVTFDGWLAYGTAGLAIADVDFGGNLSFNDTVTGYVVGAGLEKIVARNWSVKAEYLYMDLGSVTFNGDRGTAVTVDMQNHLTRVGANYRF